MTTERDLINQLAYREKKGRTEGIEIGISKRNVEIVQKLLAKNYPTDEISDITGLSEEEIERIIKSNAP